LLLVVVAACGSKDAKPGAGSAGSATVAPAPPPPKDVTIFVDDKQVAQVTPAQIGQWPRLDTLVPTDARRLGRWQDVLLQGAAAKPVDLQSPSASYPELVPALFPGADGAPAFGMFDPVELAKHGKPALREDHLSAVRVKLLAEDAGRGQHEQGQGGGKDPATLKITFVTKKGTTVLDSAKLLALPREPVPGTTESKGWALQTLLTAGGITKWKKLVLSNADGVALNLDNAAFDPKTSIPFVKLNRQGSLRMRIYKKVGGEWQPGGGDLRDLDGVEVLE
jgi:hypothetical protein